jgi:hypothetical protein
MMKLAALFCAFALVTAQTTTDGPEVESTVTTTFAGDCNALMADPTAMTALIGEINTQVSAGFGVAGADVSTTVACGSIIGTTTVSGGVTPTAPLVVTSTDFGAATITIVTGGGGAGSGGAGRYTEGGKAGKGMSGEAGKGGTKGMGGEMGFGKGMGSGKGKGKGGEKGSGKGEGGWGEKGGKGTYGSLNASATSGINRNSAAAISAGIVLVAGLGLITVRRLRSNQGYEMVTHSEMEYVPVDEKTELLRVDTQA